MAAPDLNAAIARLANAKDNGRLLLNMGVAVLIDAAADEIIALRARLAAAEKQPTAGAADVIAERERQKQAEGWTSEHDDRGHPNGELALAAACYVLHGAEEAAPPAWPWSWTWWKPKNRRRNLVRAAALLIAEIERLDRAALTRPAPEEKP